ncbi:MAG: cardiolipin synthase [Eubacterium sp.]
MKEKKKGLTKLAQIIFSRTTFIFLMVLLQLFVLFLCFYILNSYSAYIYSGFIVFAVLLSIYILNRWDNPMFKLSWIIPILTFPVFGSLLYLYCETQVGSRILNKRIADITQKTKKYYGQSEKLLCHLEIEDPHTATLARYMDNFAGFPIYQNTEVKYFGSGEEMLPYMIQELKKAKKFIFIEFFIISPGKMWDEILEVLKQKAKEGIDVRVMYDGTCSLFSLPYGYYKDLRKLGISSKPFAPIRPVFSTVQNNRDHRKIVVIDGHTSFTGGINLADEYINEKSRFGYWKDNAIMLKGEATKSFTVMFLQLWNVNEKNLTSFDKYINPEHEVSDSATGYVIGYSDSPLDDEPVGEYVYMDILNTAKKYVYIITPYLILDYEMIQALIFAAKRGIDVIIIMPGIPDKAYAYCLGRSYYEQLIDNGVKIYEFTPGFTHAKMFVSDDEKAVVGSINLDFRSLYLHFECGAYMYKCPEILAMKNDFCNTLEQCHMVTREECENRPWYYKLYGHLLRLIAPLM